MGGFAVATPLLFSRLCCILLSTPSRTPLTISPFFGYLPFIRGRNGCARTRRDVSLLHLNCAALPPPHLPDLDTYLYSMCRHSISLCHSTIRTMALWRRRRAGLYPRTRSGRAGRAAPRPHQPRHHLPGHLSLPLLSWTSTPTTTTLPTTANLSDAS